MVETAEVIKSEGDNSLLIWKSPVEDFNTGTQLIVHESQEAIFFLNGQALDLFSAGRHTLTTQNVPLLKKILNKATSDKSPFHCEIYFINKVNLPNVPWGIGDVEYMDPEFNFPLKIGASGSMVLRVDDSRKLLLKFVGTEYQLTVDSFTIKMKDFVKMKAKAYLAKFMPEQHINIFEVDQKLDEIAGGLQGLLQSDFDDYGVDLDTLLVTTIKKPEEDPQYKRFMSLYREQYLKIQEAELERRAAEVEAEKRKMQEVKAAEARAEARKIEGWDIQQEHAFGVAEKVAENEGVGNFSGMGMGMGMMGGMAVGLGAGVADITAHALDPIRQEQSMSSAVPSGGISSPPEELGIKEKSAPVSPPSPNADFKTTLDNLMMMKDVGALTDEEFDSAKVDLMKKFGLR